MMNGLEAVWGASPLPSASIPTYGLVTYSPEVCRSTLSWRIGIVLVCFFSSCTENEIRFKVVSVSSHSLAFEYALMNLRKRGSIASPPEITQSLSHALFMPAVYLTCKSFPSLCQGSKLPTVHNCRASSPLVVYGKMAAACSTEVVRTEKGWRTLVVI